MRESDKDLMMIQGHLAFSYGTKKRTSCARVVALLLKKNVYNWPNTCSVFAVHNKFHLVFLFVELLSKIL